MNSSVFGIATSEKHLRDIINRLDHAGFRRDDRSVLFPDSLNQYPLAHQKSSKAPEGAVAGGMTGASVGGIVGLLAGVGALAIPGLGALIAAGPLLGLLSGAAVGAAAGGLTGALIGLGIPEYEAKRYEGHLQDGNILIAVHADNPEWKKKAKRLLVEAKALDVAVSPEAPIDNASSSFRTRNTSSQAQRRSVSGSRRKTDSGRPL